MPQHPDSKMPDALEQARQACQSQAWSDAYEAFSRAEQSSSLSASELELYATCAFLIGRDTEYLRTLERAHRAYAAELARIEVPTALVWGRHDLATPLAVAEAASARFGWPLHVIEQAADDPALEQPEAFATVLRKLAGE